MSMSGKENYRRAIEFKGPAYLPCGIRVNLDWLQDKDEGKRQRVRELAARFPADMLGWMSPKDFGIDLGARNGVRRWQDQWGTGWEDDGHGAKTETYPLEGGYEALDLSVGKNETARLGRGAGRTRPDQSCVGDPRVSARGRNKSDRRSG